MALTTIEIEAHILAIQTMLAGGVSSVSQPDIGQVSYRSTADMLVMLAYYESLLGAAAGGTSQSVASYSKD